MNKPTVTKGETTRLGIENAARALFLEQGYHATSMRQIAGRAGLALGGIYNHFSSKEEIFEAIIIDQHPYRQILPLILAAKAKTPEEFFRSAFRIVLREMGERPDFINLMFIELVEFKGRHGPRVLKEIGPRVLPIFERIVKNRKGLRVRHPVVLMRVFFGLIISYFITEMVTANSMVSTLMPRNTADMYVDIFLKGILKDPA